MKKKITVLLLLYVGKHYSRMERNRKIYDPNESLWLDMTQLHCVNSLPINQI